MCLTKMNKMCITKMNKMCITKMRKCVWLKWEMHAMRFLFLKNSAYTAIHRIQLEPLIAYK